MLFSFKVHILHTKLNSLTVQTPDATSVVFLPLGHGSRPSALNTVRSNHHAGHDLDLGFSAKGKRLFSIPTSSFASAAASTPLTALTPPSFTLHFTADIISQISAHLVRILTDFDGLGEESHPSCYKPAFYQTLSV